MLYAGVFLNGASSLCCDCACGCFVENLAGRISCQARDIIIDDKNYTIIYKNKICYILVRTRFRPYAYNDTHNNDKDHYKFTTSDTRREREQDPPRTKRGPSIGGI
jgi:hypothetical protein